MSSVKKILKQIFPVVLLKRAHLEYNKLRIKTIDKLLFPEKSFQQADFRIRRDDYPFRLIPVVLEHLDERLQRQFRSNDDWTQDEYLLVYNQPCLIEPHYGWALSQDNQLIYPSLGFSRVPYLPKPDLAAKGMWSQPLEEFEELVSLRDTGEENYYHFYNDVLAKLFFLEEQGLLTPQTPLLIADALWRKPFFQYFLEHPYLKNRRWVVQQKGQYIRSRKTYFCKPLTHTPQYYARILDMVRPADRAITGQERRIFITRSPKRLRFIENGAEAEQVCRELGFEVVDFDEMTLAEQIQTMANSRYVVGIHGAGLYNMIFRGQQPMGLLEIYPPASYYPFHYVLVATQMGYAYDGLIGQPGTQKFSGGFYVDPAELRQRITALLQR
ncbi:glycosyltransferase family 61 protein [Hymenobacter lutimineralis]|uniref:Glycosyltransferase family 61 protein n=1 Tax=Hymenobacter lutimineralis TaxID=2606448 RepID=A0A5D6VAR1_9BACT|nr:glycosyltransferase family 61 protein [Hymenobacter lutimineralis]TYZ11919.1 glycosyltransferase family 61 protein [Hymenobacter lutimineralis]